MPGDAELLDNIGSTAAHRPTLLGTRHMVVAGHYLAAHAAFEVLEAGGNAADAGVAAGLVLGVVQSDIVNIAGVAPILVYEAASKSTSAISGLGYWPRLVDVEVFRREYDGGIPPGLLRAVVPAAPEAWIAALRRFGTMPFGEVARSAIRLARDGFVVYQGFYDMVSVLEPAYRRWPSNAAVYLPNGKVPQVGDIFVQADLARTLQFMADEERSASSRGREAGLDAARNAFYRGDIAQAIVRFHRENGGWLREGDLSEFRAEIEPAVRLRFGDVDVYACPPWCQGPVLLQMLSLLESAALKEAGHNSPRYLHVLAEAMKLAFADRERWYGDPRFVDVPLDELLSPAYAAKRRRMIRADEAWPEMPPAGDGTVADSGRRAVGAAALPLDTSYVCVVDRHGNVFSATPSDDSSDSILIPGTGLCPSGRGSQSWTIQGHPSCLLPGKRPRLTPSPALAIKPGAWIMPFGSPGGDVQPQAMLQAFLNTVLFEMDVQVAVEVPRIATFSFPDSFDPHKYFPGRLNIEGRIPAETGDELKAKGHKVQPWPNWTRRAGAVCTIRADLQTGVLSAAADPRRPSYALGW